MRSYSNVLQGYFTDIGQSNDRPIAGEVTLNDMESTDTKPQQNRI